MGIDNSILRTCPDDEAKTSGEDNSSVLMFW